MEINTRYNVIRKGQTVVDLGCSPGGWSQFALETVGIDPRKPRVFGMDILPMDYVDFADDSCTDAGSCRATCRKARTSSSCSSP